MWTNFAVSCPGRGPMLNLMVLVVADYCSMYRHPFILKAFVIIPEVRVTAVSKLSMDPCVDSPCVDFCVGTVGVSTPCEGGRGALAARVGTAGITSGWVVTSGIEKTRAEESLTRRGKAPGWSPGAGTSGNASNRTCSSQVFHVKHWYTALELQCA